MALRNYGAAGARGAWEIDHGVPLSKGGSHHINNLDAACISCNREKSDMTTTEYRRWVG